MKTQPTTIRANNGGNHENIADRRAGMSINQSTIHATTPDSVVAAVERERGMSTPA
jgi:hypothetical protein